MLLHGVGAKIQLVRGDGICSLSFLGFLFTCKVSRSMPFLLIAQLFTHLNFLSCIGAVCIRAKYTSV